MIGTSVAFLILAVLSTGAQGVEPEPGPTALYDLIGLSCGQPESEVGLVSWRPEMPGIDRSASMRIFKHFQGRDTERCLLAIIRSDPRLWATFERLNPERQEEDFVEFLAGVHSLWTRHGVAEALEEFAVLGRRGEAVDRLLDRCRELDDPDGAQ